MGTVIALKNYQTEIYRPNIAGPLCRPLFSSVVPAGFPSPADDYIELDLDLHEYLISHPSATFYVRLAGDSMDKAGFNHGDILIVDRAEEAQNGDIVIAAVDNELTVKRLFKKEKRLELRPESTNPIYQPLVINAEREFLIWGVVTGSVRKIKK